MLTGPIFCILDLLAYYILYDGIISCIVCTWKLYIQYIELTTSKG